ncbi:MAG: helix-turn-helix domain-containing protein [Muribaculaceae bacterium]|nr:helix-turn-helix domain-containing protein [Muribaculaceae bacterium]
MEHLKELRLSKGLTLKELSQELQISPQVISRYELGQHEADYKTTYKIAQYFDVSIEYLLGFSDLFYPKSISNEYSVEEQKLVEDFRQLNRYKQELIKNNIKAMLPAEAESMQKKKI